MNLSILLRNRSHCLKNLRRSCSSDIVKGREFVIPVPWGVIRGKEWGHPEGLPWLAIHGWLDNAGTFNTLLPHIGSEHRFLAVDVPGHGLSSHLPKGITYNEQNQVVWMERVVRHFGWDKFSLIGHSMGGQLATNYTTYFPERVKSLISLDMMGPAANTDFYSEQSKVFKEIREGVSHILDHEKLAEEKPPKIYSTHEAAVERMLAAAATGWGPVTREAAEIMLTRGLKEVDGGFTFSRDIRLMPLDRRNYSLNKTSREFLLELAANIACPHLLIKADKGPWYDTKERNEELLNIYKTNDRFEYHTVEGSHHVHLSHSERVLPIINLFLDKCTN